MSTPEIVGHWDRRFGPVRDAFAQNFSLHDEIGACVAVSVGGRMVVDLWGGRADRAGRPWERDTIVDVFSVGKAMVAICLLRLVERGSLGFDDPVSAHWPEFAAAGKASVTVAQLLSHQAGLPGIRHPLPPEALYDWATMTTALAAEAPWWEPGSAIGYQVNTLGFLGGELVRRVSGQPFADFFAREVAQPLDADFHFGLGPAQDVRVADFYFAESASIPTPGPGSEDATFVYGNPPGASGIGTVNTRAWRAAVHPSTNGHANARAIARIYEPLANGGDHAGVHLLGAATLAAATTELAHGHDRILDRPSRFGFGFQLTMPERPLGPGRAELRTLRRRGLAGHGRSGRDGRLRVLHEPLRSPVAGPAQQGPAARDLRVPLK